MIRNYEIILSHRGSGDWLARCYEAVSGEHVWSSENAATAEAALHEVFDGIKRHEQVSA